MTATIQANIIFRSSSHPLPVGDATPAPAQNPFEAAKLKLIERLSLLVAPKPIRLFPGPSDFEAARDHLREAAEIFDDWIAAIGREIEDNSPYSLDVRSFDKVASGAIADASYECEAIAERMIEDRDGSRRTA